MILADDNLPILEQMEEASAAAEPHPLPTACSDRPLEDQVRDFEAEVIRRTLESCGGNRTQTMRMLGVSRRTFYRKCAELNVLESDRK